MPIARPAKHAMKNDVKPARSAAASAGTTWKASVCASRAMRGATRMPRPPATTLASTVFVIASRFGESPTSIAETSFSDAARVDSPNGVHRKSAASAAATTITIPVRRNRSIGTTRSKTVVVSEGRTAGADFSVFPKITIMPASRTSRRPSDAASLASGAVFLSGRKIASSITAPKTAMQTSVKTNAGTVASSNPK